MSSSPPRAFPLLLSILAAGALAVLVSLGVWQMQRLAWKQDLMARIDAARTAPPVPLDEALARPDPEFARVTLVCRGLDRAPWIELRTLMDGEPGVRLISLCSDETPILVDRGFVAETLSARPPSDGGTMPVAVRGVLRRGEAANAFTPPAEDRRVYVRDLAAMSERLGGGRTDLMLVAETSTNPEWRALTPSALPAGLTNNHLGYALTWFGLALALVGVYATVVYRRIKS
jgi:surfeit locus 1 family protein